MFKYSNVYFYFSFMLFVSCEKALHKFNISYYYYFVYGNENVNVTFFSCIVTGPFVMNTEDEIQQAISDYRTARNGFEKARTWNSETGKAK